MILIQIPNLASVKLIIFMLLCSIYIRYTANFPVVRISTGYNEYVVNFILYLACLVL